MRLGLQTLQFVNDPTCPLADQIEELMVVARDADECGIAWLSASQHWLSAPTIWPQPFPLLARLAGEAPRVRLMTQMLLLPLHNPVDVAEQVATLDQISRGRVTVGIANGYRDAELRAAGIVRKDRAGRVEEGIDLLTRLWGGDEVRYAGRWTVEGRMGFTTYQRPRPPIVLAAQSEAAARRAARIADGVFFGPQVARADLAVLARAYRGACTEAGRAPGIIGAGRPVFLGPDREAALATGREYAERTARTYAGWDMQETSTVSFEAGPAEIDGWALVGRPRDCVAELERYEVEVGLTHVTLTAYNLPRGLGARRDYVRQLGEIVAALGDAATDGGIRA